MVKRIVTGLAWLGLFIPGCNSGYNCSVTLAPKINSQASSKILDTHFDGSIAVTGKYSKDIQQAIEQTHLFNEVTLIDDTEDCSGYDLIAEYDHTGDSRFPQIPLFTLFTGGIIPTITKGEFGYAFKIYPCGQEEDPVDINCIYPGTSVYGHEAGIDAINPNQQKGCMESILQTQRFYDHLSWQIVQQADEIKLMLE